LRRRHQSGEVQGCQSTASIDLAVSSAVDLQFKLVNDGYALRYDSAAARELPDWAVWRNEAFGFTFEPAVIVYNKQRLPAADVPHTRAELNELLARQPVRFNSRVATYDPATSGVGYLFATQDAEQSPGFWELVHNFGINYVRLHDTTADILDRVASGEYLLGYNVLGSYAQLRADHDPAIGVILPQDYTLVMSRVAFIPRSAPHPELAKLFLEFLLSEAGQRIIAERTGLAAIHPAVSGPMTAARLQSEARDSLRPIRIGPGLLVYLDQFKRAKFLNRWNRFLRNRD
jgi:ABC-type Fe3+ transport system substrate-binding protein